MSGAAYAYDLVDARRRHESSLHHSLKERYAPEESAVEVVVDGYRIDVVRDRQLVEIQTRSFSPIKRKLCALLASHSVRLVYPIACEKWIVKIGPTGSLLSRRRSPKRGCVVHVFDELVSFPHLMAHPNLSLEVLLTREEEIQCDDGRGSWRRGGRSIWDRCLIEVVTSTTFTQPADFLQLLPNDLRQPFTSRGLARAMGRSVAFARRVAYCLRKMNAIKVYGMRGRGFLYALPTVPDTSNR